MKRKQIAVLLLAVGILVTTGCSSATKEQEATVSTAETQGQEEQAETEASGEDASQNSENEPEKSSTDSQQTAEGETTPYTWNEITISIPKAWEGRYHIVEDETGFSIIQSASEEKEEGMGFVCGFGKEQGNLSSLNMAGTTVLAYTADTTYYMEVPTDVCYYYEDEEIAAEYQKMYESLEAIVASLQINQEDVQYNPEEYVFPLSSTCKLNDEILINYTLNDLRIARNEIYARHGRKFDDVLLQNYFDSCTWYEDSIEAGQFDDSVLSEIEKENLQILSKAEEEHYKEYPYPKLYDCKAEVREDLDADGTVDTITYSFTETEGGYQGMLTINGESFSLEDYGVYLFTPNEEKFAVTDIDSYYDGLEIAIMDYGPSCDLITYFFAYDGELAYLGSVGGFPFMELEGHDGFSMAGMVEGVVRTDLIHTCYGYSSWRYDYGNKQLEAEEQLLYRLVPDGAHELYEELPVYASMDVTSAKTTIPEQKEVFFLETDAKEWLLVKGKDGSKGYVHIVDGKVADLSKEPTEVFSNVVLAD